MSITVHSIVRNEDQFIWYALTSVLPYVTKILIYDTGSSDRTSEIIKSINNPKIIYEEKGVQSPQGLVELRQEQINRTDTDFFMILDGDEIWPKQSIETLVRALKTMPANKIAVYCRTRNAIGDIYHYLPQDSGKYEFQGTRGHFNMRVIRNVPGITVSGIYPQESYMFNGRSLNNQDDRLQFVDVWYLHATHLIRSSSKDYVSGFRYHNIETGISFKPNELPEVFIELPKPRRNFLYELLATIITPLKLAKRILIQG